MKIYSPTWGRAESYGRIALELARRISPIGEDRLVLCFPDIPHSPADVILTMWDSSKPPPKWVDALNTYRAIITPAQWGVEMFRANGVTVPIHVVPLGISSVFHYRERPARTPYTFTAIADYTRRKHWDKVLFAYLNTFGNDPNYRLRLKVRQLSALRFSNPTVEVVAKDLDDADMAQFYADADCMVFPAACEGFGFPPREFAATGGDVIATAFSGLQDDIDCYAYPLRHFEMVKAFPNDTTFGECDLGEWASPDMDEIKARMLWCAEHRDTLNERGYERAQNVKRLYSWDECARKVEAIVCH